MSHCSLLSLDMEETVQEASKAIADEYRAFRDVKMKEMSEFIHQRSVLFSERMDGLMPGYGGFIEALTCLTDGQLKEVEEILLKEAPKA